MAEGPSGVGRCKTRHGDAGRAGGAGTVCLDAPRRPPTRIVTSAQWRSAPSASRCASPAPASPPITSASPANAASRAGPAPPASAAARGRRSRRAASAGPRSAGSAGIEAAMVARTFWEGSGREGRTGLRFEGGGRLGRSFDRGRDRAASVRLLESSSFPRAILQPGKPHVQTRVAHNAAQINPQINPHWINPGPHLLVAVGRQVGPRV